MTIEYKNGRVISSGNVPEGLIYIKEYYADGEKYNGCKLFGFLSIESTYNMWGELIERETIREQRSYFGKNEYHCLLDVTIGERTYTARKVLKMTANEWEDENDKSLHYTQQSFSDSEFDYYRCLISEYIDGYHDYSSGVEISWKDSVIVNHDGYANGFQEKYYSTLKRVDFGTHIEWASRNIKGYYSPSDIHRVARDGWRIPTRYEFEELLRNSRITFSSNFRCGYCNIEHTSGWGDQVVLTLEAAKHNGWWIADDDVRAEHVGYYLVDNPGGSPQVLRICDDRNSRVNFLPAMQGEKYSVLLVKDKQTFQRDNGNSSSHNNRENLKSLKWHDHISLPNKECPYFLATGNNRYYFLDRDLNEYPSGGFDSVLYYVKLDLSNQVELCKPSYLGQSRTLLDRNPWVLLHGKWGQYDWSNKSFYIQPQYTSNPVILDSYSGRALILLERGGKYGIMENGSFILPIEYDCIEEIMCGIFACRKNGQTSLYSNCQRKFVISNLDAVERVNTQTLKVYKDGYWGIYDTRTLELIGGFLYDDIKYVTQTLYIVSYCGKYGVLNTNEDVFTLGYTYESIESYSGIGQNDILFVVRRDGDYGIYSLLDKDFLVYIQYDSIEVKHSFAVLKKTNLYGVYDLKRKQLLFDCKFESVEISFDVVFVYFCGIKKKYTKDEPINWLKHKLDEPGFPLLPGCNRPGREPVSVDNLEDISISELRQCAPFAIRENDIIRFPINAFVIKQCLQPELPNTFYYFAAVERNGAPSWVGLSDLVRRDSKGRPIGSFRELMADNYNVKELYDNLAGKSIRGGSVVNVEMPVLDQLGNPIGETRLRAITLIDFSNKN